MAAINDITGDAIQTRTISDAYRNNYELVFPSKKKSTKVQDNDGKKSTSCDEIVTSSCDIKTQAEKL